MRHEPRPQRADVALLAIALATLRRCGVRDVMSVFWQFHQAAVSLGASGTSPMIHRFFHDLKPPRVRVDRQLEFVLRTTFGESCDASKAPASGSAAWRWACQLGLCAPLVERLLAAQMQGCLGLEVAKEIEAVESQASRGQAALEVARERLEQAVTGFNVDLVLLDAPVLVSLNQKTHAPRASDMFLLVEVEQSRDVTMALSYAGFKSQVRESPRGSETAFLAPEGGALLLERQLRFVRMVPGGVFVDVACLKRCGQLVPHAVTDGHGIWRPLRPIDNAST